MRINQVLTEANNVEDLTDKDDGALSLMVFNTRDLYDCRHDTAKLKQKINSKYKYTSEQYKELVGRLKEDKAEIDQDKADDAAKAKDKKADLNEERDLEKDDEEFARIKEKNAEKKEKDSDAAKRRSVAYQKKVAKEGKKPLSAENRKKNADKKAYDKKAKDLYDSPESAARIKAGEKYKTNPADRDEAARKRKEYAQSDAGKAAATEARNSGRKRRADQQHADNKAHAESAKKAHEESLKKIPASRRKEIEKDKANTDATTKFRREEKEKRETVNEMANTTKKISKKQFDDLGGLETRGLARKICKDTGKTTYIADTALVDLK